MAGISHILVRNWLGTSLSMEGGKGIAFASLLFSFFLSPSTSPSVIKHFSPPSVFLAFFLPFLFPHPTEIGWVEVSEWLCGA